MKTKVGAAVDRAVDVLFVNGAGQEADRLVLTTKDGRDLGGWCRGAVRDQILDALTTGLAGDVAEVKRLAGWLAAIDGGDRPIRDESRLRQMAYEAITLGRPAPEEDQLLALLDNFRACQAEFLREQEGIKEIRRIVEAHLAPPDVTVFLAGVEAEAKHQVARWGEAHDDRKDPEEWFWALGYLAGKALAALRSGDLEKARHHLISNAALLANQHRRLA